MEPANSHPGMFVMLMRQARIANITNGRGIGFMFLAENNNKSA
jgi:hypothetical protein